MSCFISASLRGLLADAVTVSTWRTAPALTLEPTAFKELHPFSGAKKADVVASPARRPLKTHRDSEGS